ncbi:hypothetical protein [Rubrivivax benzoatilyticus]|uniref:DUF2846 domain-containing protein n=1 Tax=Rubrivivax benzoatilyticus TaxID=316997 RepID=A0ABX0HP70_9BURK|nr:hypothetical protein [Rubrivivax benzoatilyticus]NHK96876.1 hypothetical protein [Rubrivivax benzoatilyticus]NHL24591.1 hypothetical protein [Rubrivivax benzoatilyticus]
MINRRCFLGASLGVSALAAGCDSLPLQGEKEAVITPGKGWLFFSLTASEGKPTISTWFYFRKKGDEASQRLKSNDVAFFVRDDDFPELPDRLGRAQALMLEPGEYEMFTWTIYIPAVGGYGYISPREKLPVLTFTVEADRATYIGALHIETLMGKNIFGLAIPGGGLPECSDQFERDLGIIRRKNPGLAALPVDKQVLNIGAWTRN